MFIDSVVEDSDGIPMRQIPIGQNFSSSLWVSEDGIVRRRYFNSFNKTWSWGELLKTHLDENTGSCYMNIGKRKIGIKRIIAISWVLNSKNRMHPRLIKDDDGSVASNIFWSDSESDEEYVLEEDNNREEWKSFCPTDTTNFPQTDNVEISSLGRFRNIFGEVTEGTFVSNKKVVCLSNRTVNVQNMVDQHFHGKQVKTEIPSRIKKLLVALREDKSIEEYAKSQGLYVSTVWSYMYDVFLAIDVEEAMSIAKKIISTSAFTGIYRVFENEKEDIFSTNAKTYMQEIDRLLVSDPEWRCNPNRYIEIRLLKLLCQKTALL